MRTFEPWYEAVHALLRPPLATWFRWRYEGLERVPREGPLLIAANHISYLDPLAMGLMLVRIGRRPRFLAKSELFRNPVLAAVLRGARQIPVERGSGSASPLRSAVQALRRGEAVVVYPEATVTRNADFTPMRGKTGVARLAVESGTPVLPIAVWGSAPVWQRGRRRDLRFGRPIWMKVGEFRDLATFGDLDDLTAMRSATDAVMDDLSGLVADLRRRYPKEWS